ncbi:MAG: ComEC/Rec2 family competence protein [Tannerella sp.]|jgi:competence protein ComEC|nr:ComEC/Rec2 family competence protein [Tannerella sp.]
MLEEIQKRPFARPLFWLIMGILLQVCFPLQHLSWLLLIVVAATVLISLCFANRQPDGSYQYRWVWGVLMAFLILFVAIQATELAEQRRALPPSSSWLQEKAKQAQTEMIGRLDELRLPDETKAVLAAITINYTKTMTRETRSRFSATGVAHLFSVGGFHVGIVCAFLGLLFAVFPKRSLFHWIKFLLTISLLWAFTFLAGLSNPAVRAALMFTIYLTGQMLKQQPERYNTLAATAFCMLVYKPFFLFDIGFQLSFSAVFFILYLQPRLYRLIELRNPIFKSLWGVLTVTVAAQTGIVFLSCLYFGECSTVFLFTNLFLSLLSTLLIPLTLVWMIVPSGIPGLEILQWIIEVLSRGMMEIVYRFSMIPGATLSLRFDFITSLSAYCILGLLLYYFRTKQTRLLLSALLLVLFLLCRQIFFMV